MKVLFFLLIVVATASCKTTTYYVSRHAEKADNTANPPLSAEGEKQSLDLRDYLKRTKLGAVYSTNFLRTIATAKPTNELHNLAINVYNPAQGFALVDSLKTGNRKNILIIGHSNTVDDLVNRFTGLNTVTDLPDSEYGSLFIVKKVKGRYVFAKNNVPKTTPR